MQSDEGQLATVTIYRSPLDYPGKFVVRRFWIEAAGPVVEDLPLAVVATIEQARAALPPGMWCLGREPGDDLAIVETWI